MTRRLDVSVVLFRPDPAELADFLGSLAVAAAQLTAAAGVTTRLWLIDNGFPVGGGPGDPPACDADAVRARLGDAIADVRALRGHGNVGYGVGHNLALTDDGDPADYHLIANSDLLLDPDALTLAAAYLDAHPTVGLLTPRVVNRAGAQEFTCKRAPAALDLLLRGFAPAGVKRLFHARLARYEMRDVTLDQPRHDIELATGAFMFFRGATLRRLGGFDPRFFLYFEDFDLSKRAAALGQVAYVPAVRVTHFGGHAGRKGWRHRRMFIASMIQYFNKHGWRLA